MAANFTDVLVARGKDELVSREQALESDFVI